MKPVTTSDLGVITCRRQQKICHRKTGKQEHRHRPPWPDRHCRLTEAGARTACL